MQNVKTISGKKQNTFYFRLLKKCQVIIIFLSVLFLPLLVKAQQTKAENIIEWEKNALKLVEAIKLGDDDAVTFYNAACYFSLAGKTDEAFSYLQQAINHGYTNVERIKSDSDLQNLHNNKRWQSLIHEAAIKQQKDAGIFYNQKSFWDSPSLQTPFQENLSENEKIAGLSKFWSEVKFNFSNFDLVPDINWDEIFLAYLPKVRQTKSTLDYYLVLKEMCAKLRDGHTNLSVPKELRDRVSSKPALRTNLIEGRVIVIDVYDSNLKQSGIETGLEIIEIAGKPVKEYAEERIIPFQSASTKQNLETNTYFYELLNGSNTEPVTITFKDVNGKIFTRILERKTREELNKITKPLQPFEYKILPGNIALVALNSFENTSVADLFEKNFDEINKSSSLIIDLRENSGGNNLFGFRILSILTNQPFQTSAWWTRQYRPSFRAWGRSLGTYGKSSVSNAPNGHKFYSKPVIVLTSARTFSAAEDFTAAFVFMKRGVIIGEPTGGSTGQPLIITLPGGGIVRICTKRDTLPDGTDFVGKGLQPDILISPTVSDFRRGRDAVLEKALEQLKKLNSQSVNMPVN